MTGDDPDLLVLRHVSRKLIVFHNGLWGSEMCYMWASPERGRGCGRVGQSVVTTLDQLLRSGLVAIEPGQGATDVPVVLTENGLAQLHAAGELAGAQQKGAA